MYCWIREIVQSCISYPLKVMKKKKVHFVFICDIIKQSNRKLATGVVVMAAHIV